MAKNSDFQVLFRPLSQWIRAQAATKLIVTMAMLVVGVLASFEAAAAPRRAQTGIVTHVVDGDTVWVQVGSHNKPLVVRLQGIDAPEICQAGGLQAQAALKSRVVGQSVTVTSSAHDDYGRTVGTLHMQGQDIARWLVAGGHAWVYSYRHQKPPYASEFAQAQAAGLGAFSDAQAQEPRLFRKAHGSCYAGKHRLSSYRKSSGL
jgi:micrococcal nuclease